MSTGTETAPAWPGWPGFAWQACRWVVAGCVLASALLVVAGFSGTGGRGWGAPLEFWASACLRITAVLAIFLPMVVAVRYGRWGFSPFSRSIAQLTLAGWVAAWTVFVGTLALWAVA
ncbi:MAG: hypothetical protein DYG92_02160 [Leptolyngbya sp. PLA1]|nr:hypothetical protein [Leptolyngbya sp. PLA1]